MKKLTVGDAITVLECSRPYASSGCGASDEEIDEAMLMGAEALERTQWIPVGERLPEEDGRFLTYIVNPYNKFSYIMVFANMSLKNGGQMTMKQAVM